MELRNVEADLSRFRTRIFVFTVLVLVCFFLLLFRLVYLQVWRPGRAPPHQHAKQHVGQQSQHEREPDEARVDRHQQALAGAHDHRRPPVLAGLISGAGSGRAGASTPTGASTSTCDAPATSARGTQ